MALSKRQLEVKLGNKTLTVDEFGDLLRSLPEKTQPGAERHLAEYLREAFETDEPPYVLKHRRDAYPEVGGWFSDKQRKFVMAKMRREGRLNPDGSVRPQNNRTGRAGASWTVSGRGPVSIKNTAPYSGWLFSDKYQARQPGLVGWHKVSELFERNRDDAFGDLVDYIDKEIVSIFGKG